MIRYDKRVRLFAALLSGLAGFVDAIGFIHLGGFFVSFMSGNSTRLGVGLANFDAAAFVALSIIIIFVAGVVLGSSLGRWARGWRRPVVLMLVAALLAVAAALGMIGAYRGAVVAMALAMGVENAVFEQDGEVHIGLTYMTGTLVKCGQRIAAALAGGDRMGWAPYLLLWLGLAFGGFVGAYSYNRIGLDALWIAAGAAAVFAVVSAGAQWRRARQSGNGGTLAKSE